VMSGVLSPEVFGHILKRPAFALKVSVPRRETLLPICSIFKTEFGISTFEMMRLPQPGALEGNYVELRFGNCCIHGIPGLLFW